MASYVESNLMAGETVVYRADISLWSVAHLIFFGVLLLAAYGLGIVFLVWAYVRYKTTDTMERAFVETVTHGYLYQDGDMYVFMNPQSFEQISLSADMLGDQAAFLQEGMECQIALFNGQPISIELPQRVVLEIVETEPAIKNQTASSSFKPAVLSNGVRTMVPPHVASGTRIVVATEDGSYVERAKD